MQDNGLINVIRYMNQFRHHTILIKLGGSILDDDALIASLCADLKLLKDAGIKVVIVHGGSKAIHHYLQINNIGSHFVDGLRVTSPEAMQVIEMVLCGHVNKVLVRKLNTIGIQATGMAGSDNQLLQCVPYSDVHGRVGAIKAVNTRFIRQILDQADDQYQTIPVVAPVGIDASGHAMNINADYAASHLAAALQVDKLIYLTDQDGIYDQQGQIYSQLSVQQLVQLVDDAVVQGGMLAKTQAILSALRNGLNHIHILNGSRKQVLLEELFTVNGVGTLCTQ